MSKRACLIITLLICLVVLLITSCSDSDDPPPKSEEPGKTTLSFRKFPYLLYTNNSTSMTIAWQLFSDADETCSVQWRKPGDTWQGPMESIKMNDDYLYAYTIKDLDSETIYDYEIIGLGAEWSGPSERHHRLMQRT